MQRIDLIIIGGGPAGLSTALHLLQQDADWADRMLLLEKASHPRHKLCGGGVTRLGLRYLCALGLPTPLPIPHATVRDARLRYGPRTIHIRGNPEFVVFHRQEFDHFLAQTARQHGLRICENEPVIRIERDPTGVTVTTAREVYRAKMVVGADGSRGVTRNSLRRPRTPQNTARLLEVVHPAGAHAPQFDEEYALFDFTPVGDQVQGYVWDFPAQVNGERHHNRGVYDSRVAHRFGKASLPPLLDNALRGLGSSPEAVQVQGHPIHWFSPVNPLAGERLLLAGDSAGAEPLFGEGIATALGYGKIAAEAAQAAFARDNFSFRDYKLRVLCSELGVYLLFRWWIAWWSYRLGGQPWFVHIMWTIGWVFAALKPH